MVVDSKEHQMDPADRDLLVNNLDKILDKLDEEIARAGNDGE